MKISIFSSKLGVALLVAGMAVLPATNFAAPRIDAIQYEFVPGSSGTPVRRMVKKRITKFDQYVKTPASEVFYVNWDAEQGIPAGATLIFEYRQGGSPVNQVVKFTYPNAVSGKKRTTFTIPAAGGKVSAWRVRLTHNKRVLSTRISPDWDLR